MVYTTYLYLFIVIGVMVYSCLNHINYSHFVVGDPLHPALQIFIPEVDEENENIYTETF